MTPHDVLRRVFGFEHFRGLQESVIGHVCAGGHGLVVMPTGGGKSLCYQVPALVRPGTAVVVSPLIALMQDQVSALAQLGVRAAALNSSLDRGQARTVERALHQGGLDLLYVAPERLMSDSLLGLLDHCHLALFAIDEAHCVSQWGHDFRPEYRQLAVLAERFPAVPRLALTATADARTRDDIVAALALEQGEVFVGGFDRPNIRYTVGLKHRPLAQVQRFLAQQPPGSAGIVYCGTRARVEEVATALAEGGRVALPYHAGLPAETRAAHQERFLREDGVIMVATIAFGMGIDKPDVRFVAHLDLPRSLEAYYQETGRAGRDGLPAEAWMIYGLQDVMRQRQLIEASEAARDHKRLEHRKLETLLAYGETTRCRRQVLLAAFGDTLPEPCGNCDTCLTPVQDYDGSVLAQKLLSAVYRTGQRFGAGHVIDVLRGQDTPRIRDLGHDRLSVYGIGRDLGPTRWRSVVRQLLARGLLISDPEHGTLRLDPACRPVLRGEESVRLRADPEPRATTREKRPRPDLGLATEADRALFQALRAERAAIAREQGVPPYVIFHDTTLLAMVTHRPHNRDSLSRLPGLGGRKQERYGARFLAVINGGATP